MDSFRDTDRVDADIIVETIDDDFAVAVVEAVAMGDADYGDSDFVMLIRTMLTQSVPLIDIHSATPGIDAPGLSYPYQQHPYSLPCNSTQYLATPCQMVLKEISTNSVPEAYPPSPGPYSQPI